MNENNKLTFQETVRIARMQIWILSLVCGLLCLFAIAAATRIPHYLNSADYMRLSGAILFGLLSFTGLAINLQSHLWLRQLKDED